MTESVQGQDAAHPHDTSRRDDRSVDSVQRPVHLLFTCTANRVRSPLAATIATSHAHRLGLEVEIRSGGVLGAGLPATDDMVWAAKRLGHDLSGHRSSTVSTQLLDWADLIVPMTGQHVVDLVGMSVECRPRTVTLKEWAAATESDRSLTTWTPRDVREWAADVTDRPLQVLLSGSLDVADPIGRPRRFYRRAATQIDELLTTCFSPVDRAD